MILLDTSAWILSFQKQTSDHIKEQIKQYIAANEVCTSPLIILELVQGSRSQTEKQGLIRMLNSLHIVTLTDETWNLSYNLAFDLRRKGYTIPTIDILIASQAIKNNCRLLHHDRHYSMISEQYSELHQEFLSI